METTTKTNEAIAENAYELAFNHPEYTTTSELEKLLELGCDATRSACDAIDVLDKNRKTIEQLMQQLKDTKGDLQTKLAVLAAWQPILEHLNTACKMFGRDL